MGVVMEEPRIRRSRLQFTLNTIVIAVLLLGPLVIGPMLPVPDFVREWQAERRPDQLIYTSDDLRELQNTWERIWFLDQPDELTPERVHGGVI